MRIKSYDYSIKIGISETMALIYQYHESRKRPRVGVQAKNPGVIPAFIFLAYRTRENVGSSIYKIY